MPNESNHNQSFGPEICRARIEKLTIYEISEPELEILEHGTPTSIYLNIAIFLLAAALSFLVSLLTTKINSAVTQTVFIVVTITGFTGGFIMAILWWKNYKSATSIGATIRKRLPPDGTAQPLESV